MARRPLLLCVLAAAGLLFSACDKGGIHPLGSSKDVVVPCVAHSTWIRSKEHPSLKNGEPIIATEVLVIGASHPDEIEAELDLAELAEEEGICFYFATIDKDSSAEILQGRLVRNAANQLEAEIGVIYGFLYQPEKSLLSRTGAIREELRRTREASVDFAMDGDQLLFTYDGEARRLTRIEEVIARLDPEETELEAPGGPKDIYRMFNLSLFMGQTRVPAFGGGGMTTYEKAAEFTSIIANGFKVDVTSLVQPDVYITYEKTQELDGIIVDGVQITYANMQGKGTMGGVLEVEFYTGPVDEEEPYFTAYVDYADVIIERGVGGGGTYTLTVGDPEGDHLAHVLGYDIATDEDFTNILPVEEGLP